MEMEMLCLPEGLVETAPPDCGALASSETAADGRTERT
jgi:hypothetical protein